MRTLTLEERDLVSGGCDCGCGHANNGWGDGDDRAPGNSLAHNKAENNVTPGANHKGEPARPG